MNFEELIKLLEPRCPMYTGSHGLTGLVAFLNGWRFRNLDEEVNVEILVDFEKWLQNTYEFDDSSPWSRILLYLGGDDHAALKLFFVEFNKFLKERIKEKK
jgi:hypothetical protein